MEHETVHVPSEHVPSEHGTDKQFGKCKKSMNFDYDISAHHVPKWNTLNLKHPNSLNEPNNHFKDPIVSEKLRESYRKHMNEYENDFNHQDHSFEFYEDHLDQAEEYPQSIKEYESRHRQHLDVHHKYENRPAQNHVHRKRTPKHQVYSNSHIDRSGEFVASPMDPGMSYPGEDEKDPNLLTPYPTKSSYHPVYFNGAYRGQYVDNLPTRRSRSQSNRSLKSVILNSSLGRGVRKIKNRLQRGGKRVFFRNNQGGLSGSSFNSPSYGINNLKDSETYFV